MAYPQIGIKNSIATQEDRRDQVAGRLLDATSLISESSMLSVSDNRVPTQKSVVEYIANQSAGGVTYRGTLFPPFTFFGTTGNAYLDSVTDVKTGDMFVSSSSGFITFSDGDKYVQKGDALIANKTVAKTAALKSDIDDISPTYPSVSIGDYKRRAVSFGVEPSWLLCEGQAVSRTTYINLFNTIGETFGAGDGSSTFNLPDPRGRAVVAAGQGSGLTNRAVGQVFGEERTTLTEAEMPSHDHTINHDHPSVNTSSDGSHTHDYEGFYTVLRGVGLNRDVKSRNRVSSDPNDYAGNSAGSHTHSVNLPNFSGTSGNAGSGQSHNNLQPTLVDGHLFIYAG